MAPGLELSKSRELVKSALLLASGAIIWWSATRSGLAPGWQATVVVGACLAKTAFFVAENLRHLALASARDMAYHRFLMVMAICMSQMIISFALDYFCLYRVGVTHFSGVAEGLNTAEQLFEFFYFSTLNFSFFGFGDLTPATIPAKIITLLEVALSFLTLIFILSDFLGMKESLQAKEPSAQENM
jgi:hypothetical protein